MRIRLRLLRSVAAPALAVACLSACGPLGSTTPTPTPAPTYAAPTTPAAGTLLSDIAVPTPEDFKDPGASSSLPSPDAIKDLSAPLVTSDAVYVASGGHLSAYKVGSRAQLWHWPAPTELDRQNGADEYRVYSRQAPREVVGGILVLVGLAGQSGTYGTDGLQPNVALISDSGKLVWHVPASELLALSPNKDAFYTSELVKGKLQLSSHSVGTGKVVWSVPFGGGEIVSGPGGVNSYLVALDRRNGVGRVFNAETGKAIRSWFAGVTDLVGPGVASHTSSAGPTAPVDPVQTLLVGSVGDKQTVGVNLATGKKVFTTSKLGAPKTWQLTPGAVVATGKGLSLVNPAKGKAVWSVPEAKASLLAAEGSSVVFARSAGNVVAVDAATGQRTAWSASAARGLRPLSMAAADTSGSTMALLVCGEITGTCTDPRLVQLSLGRVR